MHTIHPVGFGMVGVFQKYCTSSTSAEPISYLRCLGFPYVFLLSTCLLLTRAGHMCVISVTMRTLG